MSGLLYCVLAGEVWSINYHLEGSVCMALTTATHLVDRVARDARAHQKVQIDKPIKDCGSHFNLAGAL